jgi:drug/metabolite transporter (DMT)-like permease
VDGVLFALAAGASFGALTVSIRVALSRAPDVLGGSFTMTAIALPVAVAGAVVTGAGWEEIDPRELWPFLLLGALVPGVSQVLATRAVRDAGPSRAGIVMGMAPLGSALIAITVLREPIEAGLVAGTVLVVAAGVGLALERGRPAGFRILGVGLAATVAAMFAVRDNVVRWASGETDASPLVAVSATFLVALPVLFAFLRWKGEHRVRTAGPARLALAFLPAGVVTGIAQVALYEAFDRTRVTVAAPLAATAVLWTVVFSAVFLGRTELVGRRLFAVAALVVAGGALIGVSRG